MTTTGESIESVELRPAGSVLDWGRALLRPALGPAVDRLPAPMRHITGYHLGWWDAHGAPAQADSGKAMRPTLSLLAAEAVGGEAGAAVPVAVAVELVHNFSLLHDDVMDGDDTRRHRPTAWRAFGVSQAILAGDSVLALAFDVLAASGHPFARAGISTLSATVQELLNGQSSDVEFEGRAEVELAECLRMASGKTGALIACACALGGLFGDGTAVQVEHLRAFGDRVGLAFQLADDLLGIWGDPAVTGKPVYSDLANRKKSLPVVAALTSGTAAGRELAAVYRGDALLSHDELTHAADLIENAGGRAWSRATADDLLAEGLAHLDAAGLAPRPAGELRALARSMTRRTV
ncbi:dimethylallyltransferase [Acrocarpospora corrugata]|uniref:Dimethylallyltransferase n=1 Tax=Acrocarpospora corrugata TaxID=35763 RepID=A0A5M3W6G4_9ACTN|nr:family 2 encapsulin nanocompartment cargo protein polyprenyl transferase [Acrocarpospora corrugata]GES03899.1 dimethylallyltransferase [Acrocarpospora corrugata]